MTTAAPDRPTAHPAAAGGSAANQLAHLRTHLEFQRQDQYEEARINWCTVITREQSRHHITRALHEKINCKAAVARGESVNDQLRADQQAAERRRQLDMLAQGLRQRRAGFPSGGDWHLLNRRLAGRILQAFRPRCDAAEIQRLLSRYSYRRGEESCVPPEEVRFPREIQYARAVHRLLKAILKQQGRSPTRARTAVLRAVYACQGCRQLIAPDALLDPGQYRRTRGQCPECQSLVHGEQEMNVAVLKEQPHRLVGQVEVLGRRRDNVVERDEEREAEAKAATAGLQL